MNKVKKIVNKLIVNYVYGIKTNNIPEIKLPLNKKTISFARKNRTRLTEMLDFQPEMIESENGYYNAKKLPISQNALDLRADRIFQAVQAENFNFLSLANPQNIDNPNYKTDFITKEIASVFEDINDEVLRSEDIFKHKDNEEVLQFLKDNGLVINDYVQKGISVSINGGSLEVFKKIAEMLDISFTPQFSDLEKKETKRHVYGMEWLEKIPDRNFSQDMYNKFVEQYGKYLPQIRRYRGLSKDTG